MLQINVLRAIVAGLYNWGPLNIAY
jgi:hypothetical protein